MGLGWSPTGLRAPCRTNGAVDYLALASSGVAMSLDRIGSRLHELLERDEHRQLWLPYAGRRRGPISQAAVAQVLANYLWEAGLADEHNTSLPRRLKDRVGRALRGEALSAETLGWLTHAFDFDEDDAEGLWALLGEAQEEATGMSRSAHRTVSLHEYHYLGPDGLPERHQTIQLIKSLIPELTSYLYVFDTDELEVEVERGGTASRVRPRDDGFYEVEIQFHRPLSKGKVTTLHYTSIFHYHAAPEPVFRRQARRPVENMELSVAFHPNRLPRRLWWATWEDLDKDPITKTPTTLDTEGIASEYVTDISHRAVGFAWKW